MKINTHLVLSHSVLLRTRNVSDEHCRGNQSTHFVIRNFFFENRAFYEIIWKNIIERGRAHMTMWFMRIASWITKATLSLTLCNICRFSTATIVAQRHLNVTFIFTLPVLFNVKAVDTSRKQEAFKG